MKKGKSSKGRRVSPKGRSRSSTSKGTKNKAKREILLLKETDSILKTLIDKEKEIIQTEDALVESMKRFRDLFEQSPIGVSITSVKGELLVVNKAFLETFGIDSFSKVSKQNLFKDFGASAKDIKKIQEGKVVQYEKEYDFDNLVFDSDKEGVGYALFTISPLFRDENIIGYLVQIQDITQRKKVEEAQRLAHLGRLLSDMAHEVNNPLMVISGRAELALLDEKLDPKVRDSLGVILDQCFMAKDIIQRLLKYSRIGKIQKNPVDIEATLELISNILQHHFKMSNIELKIDLKTDLPQIMGNEKQIQEVFMNILRNASDAMPDGGLIAIRGYREKGHVRIEITDTGEGIPEKVLERIFEPFFTTKQQGTGLGLAVCHTIIQEHGGDLFYESTEGEGTKAVIMIPF